MALSGRIYSFTSTVNGVGSHTNTYASSVTGRGIVQGVRFFNLTSSSTTSDAYLSVTVDGVLQNPIYLDPTVSSALKPGDEFVSLNIPFTTSLGLAFTWVQGFGSITARGIVSFAVNV